jgi:hypothetical protein
MRLAHVLFLIAGALALVYVLTL